MKSQRILNEEIDRGKHFTIHFFIELYELNRRISADKLDLLWINLLGRVLLDWIAGLFNPDCNPIWWIGL